MILFIGDEDRGFFIRDTATVRGEELSFLGSSLKIRDQITEIMTRTADYLVFDIEQYVDAAGELAEEIRRIKKAKNCTVIIYAPGYDKKSRIILELAAQGIRYFIYSGNSGEAREELECCLAGYYKEPEPEVQEIAREEEKSGKIKIGITGACSRIGTTTFALQMVKYLQLKGYKACYIEVNSTGFVEQHEKTFVCTHDAYMGKVVFGDVDMFYRPEQLTEVLKQDYDYYIYDFGNYMDTDYNKTSFLEKDIRIFVLGTKASEMLHTNVIIRNEYYSDVLYVFNFISEKEKSELLEYMEEKAKQTYFTVYAPDQFEYMQNDTFEKILPVQDVSEDAKQKRKRFWWNRKKAGDR